MVIERLGMCFMAVGVERYGRLLRFLIHGKYMENTPFHARRPL